MIEPSWLDEMADHEEITLLRMDGFDDCCDFVVCQADTTYIACYNEDKIIEKLMTQDMDRETAYEYFSFNMSCAYMGPGTPAIISYYQKESEE